jgi:hypothetical protein
MPSRKQRRRREKSFRHEYDYVLLDHEGNEIELDQEARRAEREAKERQRTSTARSTGGKRPARGSGRSTREPTPPSWERAFRRGGLMGVLMLLAFVFLFKNGPIGMRVLVGVFYAGAFVPLTYFVDRTAYRSYQRRLAKKG